MKKYLPLQRGLRRISQNKESGFSLIELIIVIALVTIIALLAGSHLVFLDRMMIRAELEHLYVTCYMLQRRAMMLQTTQTLTFNVIDHSYHYRQTEYRLPTSVRFGTAAGVKGPPSCAEHEISIPVTFKENSITFTPDGIIQPGAVYLTDRLRRYTYVLSCAVGHVSYLRRYQYTQGWHLL